MLFDVLNHCSTNFDIPLGREWALLCIRNACEGNIENQQFIEQLKPQDVTLQDEKLKNMGYKVKFDQAKQKFNIQKDDM